MKIEIIVNDQDLLEMGLTVRKLEESVIESLNRGGYTSGKNLEYCGFDVDVRPLAQISLACGFSSGLSEIMRIQILVNDDELSEMGITVSDLKESIIDSLEQGRGPVEKEIQYCGFIVDVRTTSPDPVILSSAEKLKKDDIWLSRNIKLSKSNMMF